MFCQGASVSAGPSTALPPALSNQRPLSISTAHSSIFTPHSESCSSPFQTYNYRHKKKIVLIQHLIKWWLGHFHFLLKLQVLTHSECSPARSLNLKGNPVCPLEGQNGYKCKMPGRGSHKPLRLATWWNKPRSLTCLYTYPSSVVISAKPQPTSSSGLWRPASLAAWSFLATGAAWAAWHLRQMVEQRYLIRFRMALVKRVMTLCS